MQTMNLPSKLDGQEVPAGSRLVGAVVTSIFGTLLDLGVGIALGCRHECWGAQWDRARGSLCHVYIRAHLQFGSLFWWPAPVGVHSV